MNSMIWISKHDSIKTFKMTDNNEEIADETESLNKDKPEQPQQYKTSAKNQVSFEANN